LLTPPFRFLGGGLGFLDQLGGDLIGGAVIRAMPLDHRERVHPAAYLEFSLDYPIDQTRRRRLAW
jgi:hypothetical protein